MTVDRFIKWATMISSPSEPVDLAREIHSLSEVKPMLAELGERLREAGRREGREQGLEKGREEMRCTEEESEQSP